MRTAISIAGVNMVALTAAIALTIIAGVGSDGGIAANGREKEHVVGENAAVVGGTVAAGKIVAAGKMNIGADVISGIAGLIVAETTMINRHPLKV